MAEVELALGPWGAGERAPSAHLDTVLTPGIFACRVIADISIANGYPVEGSNPTRGVLEVLPYVSGYVFQRYSTMDGRIWQRFVSPTGGDVWQRL